MNNKNCSIIMYQNTTTPNVNSKDQIKYDWHFALAKMYNYKYGLSALMIVRDHLYCTFNTYLSRKYLQRSISTYLFFTIRKLHFYVCGFFYTSFVLTKLNSKNLHLYSIYDELTLKMKEE